MGNPAVPDPTPGDAHDEENHPDPRAILRLVDSALLGTWEFTWDEGGGSVISCSGIEVTWMAPDMEGHTLAQPTGEMLAAAPELLRRCAQRIQQLEAQAGIVR
jgi:hypothetical protein